MNPDQAAKRARGACLLEPPTMAGFFFHNTTHFARYVPTALLAGPELQGEVDRTSELSQQNRGRWTALASVVES